MSPTRPYGPQTRELILETAADAIRANRDPSMRELAAEAGVGRATVYRHFTDVAAIHDALHSEAVEAAKRLVRARVAAEQQARRCSAPSSQQLLTGAEEFVRSSSRWTVSVTGAELRDDDLLDALASLVTAVMRRAQARGEFRREIDIPASASAFIWLTVGALRHVHRRGVPLERAIEPLRTFIAGLESSGRP